MAEWFRALDFNAVTWVQIPLWTLAGVVLGKFLVQLLGHPCKQPTGLPPASQDSYNVMFI